MTSEVVDPTIIAPVEARILSMQRVERMLGHVTQDPNSTSIELERADARSKVFQLNGMRVRLDQ